MTTRCATMVVYVERVSSGPDKTKFRLTMPSGAREFITRDYVTDWNREIAKEALDTLELVYHFQRARVRFRFL